MKNFQRLESHCSENKIPFVKGKNLSEYTSFGIGGPAALLIQPRCEEEIEAVIFLAEAEDIPLLVLGNGSNMLFPDTGYDGVILRLGSAFGGMKLVGDSLIECESGASLKELCRFACANGLTGLEFAYGIPGTVGGAIYMNAGAYGGEMKDILVAARHVSSVGRGDLAGPELEMRYRHSAYSAGDRIITGGVFRLKKDQPEAIQARMDDYMDRRVSKQPLDLPSAGSTFKRPEGAYASALIDQCGLRGKRIGGAMVSDKHAGFVVNAGGATCADVRSLIDFVQKDVKEKTGYYLACEVKIIG